MQFRDPPRRSPAENMLPMINVVFLLLIFFLLAATLAPPSPVAIVPPEVGTPGSEVPAEALALWLDASGELAHGAARGDAALAELAAARAACQGACDRVTLHADAGAEAAVLAALTPQLAAMGFSQLAIVARGR